jgi:hypothetical protein
LAEWMQNGGEEVDPIELRQENLSWTTSIDIKDRGINEVEKVK